MTARTAWRMLVTLALLCAAAPAVESVTVEAVVTSGPAPQPAGPGQEVLAGLSATVLDPPVAQQQLTITGPEWNWELLSVEFRATPQDPWLPANPERHQAGIVHPHANSPDATLHALFIDEGECRLRARVTVRYGCPETGVQWRGEDDLTVDDLAVASAAPFLIVSSPAGCVPIDGPDVCNYADIYLIDRHGRIGSIGNLVITEDAGHRQDTIPFGSNTTSGQACLPPGTTAGCYNWSSGGFHNGPATIAVEYVDQEGQPGQAAVAVQIRNLQIEAVVDDDHRPTLQWDPTDLAGEQGRTKARIRFRLRSACAQGVTILRKIYRIDQDSHNDPDPYFGWESYRFDECVVQVGDDWNQTVVQDWDWDGLVRNPEGGWEWAPKGLYAFDLEHDLSGSHDNRISRQLYSLYPETEQGQRQPRTELLGFEPLSGIFSFLVNYGLVGEHGCSLGYLHVVDPDFEHRIYDLADLHCRAHDANDGMSSWGPNLRHRLEVPVPAEFMAKQGKYWFKVTVADNHPAGELAHRIKPPLEVGQYWTQIDLDIDSDNNNGYAPPDRTGEEDVAEDGQDKPGKLIHPNLNDDDEDAVPDFADGFDRFGDDPRDDANGSEQFVPIMLQLPERIHPDEARLAFVYDASDPNQVTRTGAPPDCTWEAAPGRLRVWTKPGSAQRNPARVQDGGDWVPPGDCTAGQVGLDGSGQPVTLYLEAVRWSLAEGDQRVHVLCDPDGDGPEAPSDYQDAVKVTNVLVDLVLDELPEEQCAKPTELDPGAMILVNHDDDNANGVEDYVDPGAVQGENELVPLRVVFQPETMNNGDLVLAVCEGADRVQLWSSAERGGAPLGSPVVWHLGQDPLPDTLWVEGILSSAAPKDVRFGLTYYPVAEQADYTDYAVATVVKVDLDIDSDNSGGFDAPDRTGAEEAVEDVEGDDMRPGKVILVDDQDSDVDALPDYADGWDFLAGVPADDLSQELSFVPVVAEVAGVDPSTAMLRIEYDASDPSAMGCGWDEPYILPTGSLRLWRRAGDQARDKRPVSQTGDFLAPGTYALSELGLDESPTATWYLEAVRESAVTADLPIRLTLLPFGEADTRTVEDTVRVTSSRIELLGRGYQDTEFAHRDGMVATTTMDHEPDPAIADLLAGTTPGAYQTYRLVVHDPRATGLDQITVDGQPVPMVRDGGAWQSSEFIAFETNDPLGTSEEYCVVRIGATSVVTAYNPSAKGPSGYFVPQTDADRVMAGAVDDVSKQFMDGQWHPDNPQFTGAYGVALEAGVGAKLEGLDGWLINAHIDTETRVVYATHATANCVQVDFIHLTDGPPVGLGDVLPTSRISDLYELKSSIDGCVDDDQQKRLGRVLGDDRDFTVVRHPKYRYNFAEQEMEINKKWRRFMSLLLVFGMKDTASACVQPNQLADQLDAILALADDIANDEYASPDEMLVRIITELLPAVTDYLDRLDCGVDFVDVVKVGVMYRFLCEGG